MTLLSTYIYIQSQNRLLPSPGPFLLPLRRGPSGAPFLHPPTEAYEADAVRRPKIGDRPNDKGTRKLPGLECHSGFASGGCPQRPGEVDGDGFARGEKSVKRVGLGD